MDKPLASPIVEIHEKPFRSRFGSGLKAVSAILVLTFLFQDVLHAQAGAPAWSGVAQAKTETVDKSESKLNNITIPSDSGVARKAVAQGAGDVIINIQDAHSKVGAQESIAKILDNLVKNYSLSLIAVEGGTELVDTSVIKSFPIEEVRRKAASSLMKDGRISAGEFYSMISQEPVKLYGVDDAELYRENLEVFRALIDKKLAIRKELKALKETIRAFEEKVYSPELRDLSNHQLLHKNGSIKFTEYWEYFTKLARQKEVPYSQYPNLKKLSETVELEKEIDFKKAGLERDALVNELNTKLGKGDLEKLILQMLQYKQNKLSAGKFHMTLAEMSQKAEINPLDYKNIIFYSQYSVMYEDIDLISIFDESESFEKDVRERFFQNEDERTLARAVHCVNVLSQLLDTALTSKDYDFFVKNQASCQISGIKDVLKALSEKYGLPYEDRVNFAALEAAVPDALKFYDLASRRNQALMKNTIARMKKESVNVAALITGGFHSEGISALMDQEKLSYLVVMPKFDEKSPDRPYIAILTQKPREYEAQFKDSDFYLAPLVASVTKGTPGAREIALEYIRRLFLANREYKSRMDPNDVEESVAAYERSYAERVAARLAEPVLSVEEYRKLLSTGVVRRSQGKDSVLFEGEIPEPAAAVKAAADTGDVIPETFKPSAPINLELPAAATARPQEELDAIAASIAERAVSTYGLEATDAQLRAIVQRRAQVGIDPEQMFQLSASRLAAMKKEAAAAGISAAEAVLPGGRLAETKAIHTLVKGSAAEATLGLRYSLAKMGSAREIEIFASELVKKIKADHAAIDPSLWVVVGMGDKRVPRSSVFLSRLVAQKLGLDFVVMKTGPLRRYAGSATDASLESEDERQKVFGAKMDEEDREAVRGKNVLLIDDGIVTVTLIDKASKALAEISPLSVNPYASVRLDGQGDNTFGSRMDRKALDSGAVDMISLLLNQNDGRAYGIGLVQSALMLPRGEFDILLRTLDPHALLNLYLYSAAYVTGQDPGYVDMLAQKLSRESGVKFPSMKALDIPARVLVRDGLQAFLEKNEMRVAWEDRSAAAETLSELLASALSKEAPAQDPDEIESLVTAAAAAPAVEITSVPEAARLAEESPEPAAGFLQSLLSAVIKIPVFRIFHIIFLSLVLGWAASYAPAPAVAQQVVLSSDDPIAQEIDQLKGEIAMQQAKADKAVRGAEYFRILMGEQIITGYSQYDDELAKTLKAQRPPKDRGVSDYTYLNLMGRPKYRAFLTDKGGFVLKGYKSLGDLPPGIEAQLRKTASAPGAAGQHYYLAMDTYLTTEDRKPIVGFQFDPSGRGVLTTYQFEAFSSLPADLLPTLQAYATDYHRLPSAEKVTDLDGNVSWEYGNATSRGEPYLVTLKFGRDRVGRPCAVGYGKVYENLRVVTGAQGALEKRQIVVDVKDTTADEPTDALRNQALAQRRLNRLRGGKAEPDLLSLLWKAEKRDYIPFVGYAGAWIARSQDEREEKAWAQSQTPAAKKENQRIIDEKVAALSKELNRASASERAVILRKISAVQKTDFMYMKALRDLEKADGVTTLKPALSAILTPYSEAIAEAEEELRLLRELQNRLKSLQDGKDPGARMAGRLLRSVSVIAFAGTLLAAVAANSARDKQPAKEIEKSSGDGARLAGPADKWFSVSRRFAVAFILAPLLIAASVIFTRANDDLNAEIAALKAEIATQRKVVQEAELEAGYLTRRMTVQLMTSVPYKDRVIPDSKRNPGDPKYKVWRFGYKPERRFLEDSLLMEDELGLKCQAFLTDVKGQILEQYPTLKDAGLTAEQIRELDSKGSVETQKGIVAYYLDSAVTTLDYHLVAGVQIGMTPQNQRFYVEAPLSIKYFDAPKTRETLKKDEFEKTVKAHRQPLMIFRLPLDEVSYALEKDHYDRAKKTPSHYWEVMHIRNSRLEVDEETGKAYLVSAGRNPLTHISGESFLEGYKEFRVVTGSMAAARAKVTRGNKSNNGSLEFPDYTFGFIHLDKRAIEVAEEYEDLLRFGGALVPKNFSKEYIEKMIKREFGSVYNSILDPIGPPHNWRLEPKFGEKEGDRVLKVVSETDAGRRKMMNDAVDPKEKKKYAAQITDPGRVQYWRRDGFPYIIFTKPETKINEVRDKRSILEEKEKRLSELENPGARLAAPVAALTSRLFAKSRASRIEIPRPEPAVSVRTETDEDAAKTARLDREIAMQTQKSGEAREYADFLQRRMLAHLMTASAYKLPAGKDGEKYDISAAKDGLTGALDIRKLGPKYEVFTTNLKGETLDMFDTLSSDKVPPAIREQLQKRGTYTAADGVIWALKLDYAITDENYRLVAGFRINKTGDTEQLIAYRFDGSGAKETLDWAAVNTLGEYVRYGYELPVYHEIPLSETVYQALKKDKEGPWKDTADLNFKLMTDPDTGERYLRTMVSRDPRKYLTGQAYLRTKDGRLPLLVVRGTQANLWSPETQSDTYILDKDGRSVLKRGVARIAGYLPRERTYSEQGIPNLTYDDVMGFSTDVALDRNYPYYRAVKNQPDPAAIEIGALNEELLRLGGVTVPMSEDDQIKFEKRMGMTVPRVPQMSRTPQLWRPDTMIGSDNIDPWDRVAEAQRAKLSKDSKLAGRAKEKKLFEAQLGRLEKEDWWLNRSGFYHRIVRNPAQQDAAASAEEARLSDLQARRRLQSGAAAARLANTQISWEDLSARIAEAIEHYNILTMTLVSAATGRQITLAQVNAELQKELSFGATPRQKRAFNMARVLQETGGKKLAAALALISSNQLSGLGRPPESVAPRLMQALTSILTQPETITLERDFDGYVAGLTILSFDENGFDISYGLRSSGLILVRENLDGFRSKITDSVAALGALSNNPAPRPSMPFSELLSDFQALNEGPRLSADGAAQVKKILKKMEFVPSSALPEVRDFMKRAVNYFVLSQPLTDPSVVVSRNADGQPLTLADADKNFSLSLTRVPASGSIAVKINTPSAFYDLEVPGDDHQRLALASFILDMEKWQQRKRLIRVLAAASGFLTSMIPLLLDTYFSARPIVGDTSNVFAFLGITVLATSIFAGIGIAGAIILSNKFIGLRTASLVSGYLESRARYDVSAKAAARLAAPERSVGIVQNILLDRAGGLTGPQKSFFIGLSDTAVRTFWSELTATASRLGYSDAEKMFVDIEWFFSLPQPVRIRRTDPIAERVIKAHQAWTLVSEFLDEKVSQNQSAFARHDLEIPRLYADFRQTVRALAESRKASADKTIRIAVAGPGFYQEPVELYLLAVDSIRKAGLNPADYPIEVSVLDKKGASGIFDKFKDNKIFYGPQDIAKLQALLGGGFSLTEYFEETAEGFRIKPAFRAKFTQIDHDLETGNIFTALDLSKPQDFAVLINVADYLQPSSLARIYTNFDKLLAKEGTIYSDSFGRVPPANISGLPEQIRAQIGALSTTAIFHRIDGARFAASQTPAEKPAPVRAVSSETPVPSVKVIILEASSESYALKRDSLVRKLAEQMKMTPAETRARFLFERSAGDAKSEIARANLDLLVLDGRALVLDASNEVQNAALLGSNLRAFRRQALERRELVLSFLARISEDLEVSDPQVFSQSLSSLRLALALLVDFLPNPAVADFSFSADSRRLTVDTGLPLSEDAVAQALADTFTRQDSGFAKAALSQMTAYVRSGRADVPALLKSVKDRIDDSFTGEAAELAGAKERPLLVTLDALFTGRRSAAERENLVAQYVADKKRSDETFARHGIAPNRNKDIFITGDPELAGDRGLNEVFDVILKDAGAALDSVSAVRSYIESRRTVGAQDVIGVINHEDKAFAQGEDLASLKSYLIEVKMNFVPTKDTLYGIYGKAALVVLRGGDRRRVVLKTISEMLNEAVAQVRAELQSVGSAA